MSYGTLRTIRAEIERFFVNVNPSQNVFRENLSAISDLNSSQKNWYIISI